MSKELQIKDIHGMSELEKNRQLYNALQNLSYGNRFRGYTAIGYAKRDPEWGAKYISPTFNLVLNMTPTLHGTVDDSLLETIACFKAWSAYIFIKDISDETAVRQLFEQTLQEVRAEYLETGKEYQLKLQGQNEERDAITVPPCQKADVSSEQKAEMARAYNEHPESANELSESGGTPPKNPTAKPSASDKRPRKRFLVFRK